MQTRTAINTTTLHNSTVVIRLRGDLSVFLLGILSNAVKRYVSVPKFQHQFRWFAVDELLAFIHISAALLGDHRQTHISTSAAGQYRRLHQHITIQYHEIPGTYFEVYTFVCMYWCCTVMISIFLLWYPSSSSVLMFSSWDNQIPWSRTGYTNK